MTPMRVRGMALAIIAFVLVGAPLASAKMPQQPGDGGLDIRDGTVGYVGGSGSISGTVRGPGGSGGSGTSAPSVEPAAKDAPSVLNDGVVEDAKIPAPETQKVSNTSSASAWPGVMAPTLVATITAAGVLLLFRRRPQLS